MLHRDHLIRALKRESERAGIRLPRDLSLLPPPVMKTPKATTVRDFKVLVLFKTGDQAAELSSQKIIDALKLKATEVVLAAQSEMNAETMLEQYEKTPADFVLCWGIPMEHEPLMQWKILVSKSSKNFQCLDLPEADKFLASQQNKRKLWELLKSSIKA